MAEAQSRGSRPPGRAGDGVARFGCQSWARRRGGGWTIADPIGGGSDRESHKYPSAPRGATRGVDKGRGMARGRGNPEELRGPHEALRGAGCFTSGGFNVAQAKTRGGGVHKGQAKSGGGRRLEEEVEDTGSSEGASRTWQPGGRCCPSTDEGRGGAQRLDEVGRREAPEGRGGGRPVSGSLVHSTDLGRAPEETVVVRGQEGIRFIFAAVRRTFSFSLNPLTAGV